MAFRIFSSRRLRARREELGLTQEGLSKLAGVHWSTVARIEEGKRSDISASVADALARALQTTVDWFMVATVKKGGEK